MDKFHVFMGPKVWNLDDNPDLYCPYTVIVIHKRIWQLDELVEGIKPAYICSVSCKLSSFFCLFVCFSITLGVFALQSEITWSGASFCIAGLLTPWQNKMYYNNNVFNYLWVYCFERSSCLFCRCKKYSCAPNLWEYSLFNSDVLFSTEPFCYANRREAQILYLTLLVFW